MVIQLDTVGAQLRHSWGKKLKTLGHSRGTAGAQLGHKVTWGTVEAKAVGAQLEHSWGTVEAHLGRVKVKAIVKVRS